MMQALKESFRIFPVANSVTMREPQEPTELGGYTIPAGTSILCIPSIMHFMPHYFVRPGDYIPERFLGSAATGGVDPTLVKNKAAFIPFSSGARDCPGQRLAIMQVRAPGWLQVCDLLQGIAYACHIIDASLLHLAWGL